MAILARAVGKECDEEPNPQLLYPRIDADERGLIHSELTGKVIGIFYDVYNELGHGFLESVYETGAVGRGSQRRQIFLPASIWHSRLVSVGIRLERFPG